MLRVLRDGNIWFVYKIYSNLSSTCKFQFVEITDGIIDKI